LRHRFFKKETVDVAGKDFHRFGNIPCFWTRFELIDKKFDALTCGTPSPLRASDSIAQDTDEQGIVDDSVGAGIIPHAGGFWKDEFGGLELEHE
jgi:hypothetical protein